LLATGVGSVLPRQRNVTTTELRSL